MMHRILRGQFRRWMAAFTMLLVVSAASGCAPAEQPVSTATVAPAPETAAPATPFELFGRLFEAVQMQGLFADGKTFADAVPKRAPAVILADYKAGHYDDPAALRRFVLANFTLPENAAPPPADAPARPSRGLLDHIAALWPVLTRQPETPPVGSSKIALPQPYVVPGGRFREIYYWDSYFTMLGLVADGRETLIRQMVADFESLIDRFGHIPNGTRSYYVSRSQPPFFYLMAGLMPPVDETDARRQLAALRAEHAYWMKGEDRAGTRANAHVVFMPDGAVLNRYWDARDIPREESWKVDVEAARQSDRPAAEVYRDLRAAAESGWDFSSRWLADGRTLGTIHTTDIVPVDLNSLLWGMERAIAERCGALGDAACAEDFRRRAARRRAAILRYLWDEEGGRFVDWDQKRGRRLDTTTAATFYPLFTGLATQAQADAVARRALPALLGEGGLRTTLVRTGQQWDRPNGWAPLQWVAADGLARYGHDAEARDLAGRWVATVTRTYRATGKLLEKYDVDERLPGGGGEYPLQDGFGWTNGVTRALIQRYPALDPDRDAGR